MELIYPYDLAPIVPAPTAEVAVEHAAASEWFPVVEPSGLVTGRATRSYCHSGAKPLHPVIHIHIIDRFSRIFGNFRRRKDDSIVLYLGGIFNIRYASRKRCAGNYTDQ